MRFAGHLFHIVPADVWARSGDPYVPEDFAREGFIHCSTASQVTRVANAFFAGRVDLLLLMIDVGRVPAPIRDENLTGGAELFPHVYGPLPRAAVVAVRPLRLRDDGTFDPQCVERLVSER
jgi:uncharacterized protein (DUF952 family)